VRLPAISSLSDAPALKSTHCPESRKFGLKWLIPDDFDGFIRVSGLTLPRKDHPTVD
jgi:hypothetical protein